MQMRCIFCLRDDGAPSEEHIIPFGLLGTEEFIASSEGTEANAVTFTLNDGEVCRNCNGTLAVLDERLQDAVGVLRVFWNTGTTRKGKPPTAVRPGLFARRTESGPEVSVNDERFSVTTPSGDVIKPARDHPASIDSIRLDIDDAGLLRATSYCQPITVSKKLVRALYKMAFEALCFTRGREKVLDPRYNGIRRYILRGSGSRSIGIPRDLQSITGDAIMRRPSVSIQRIRYSFDYMGEVHLAVPFHVDLTPDHSVNWGPAVLSISDKQRYTLRLTSRWTGVAQPASSSAAPDERSN